MRYSDISHAADVGSGGAAKQAKAEVDIDPQVEVPTTEASVKTTPAEVIVTGASIDEDYEEDEQDEEELEDTIFIRRADESRIPLGRPG